MLELLKTLECVVIKLKKLLFELNEKMMLSSWFEYSKIVAEAYKEAPEYDTSAVKHWQKLKQSNEILFRRLLSRTEIIPVSEDSSNKGKTIRLMGKDYDIKQVSGEPYASQKDMRIDWKSTRKLMISIDHSDHPVFSVEDNVIFRTVHDFIVHILGNHPFGVKGEIASYNLHSKLAPPDALPALFTEIVGQASYAVVYGSFPVQKIAILKGFDYREMGKVSGYDIKNKKLMKKDENE